MNEASLSYCVQSTRLDYPLRCNYFSPDTYRG